MFQLVDSLKTRREGSISPPELAHYLKKLHRDFIFSGCALDEATRKEFSEGEKQRDELARQFLLNLDEGKAGLWLSADELDGVPTDFIDKLKEGEGEHAGHLWVPLNKPSLAKVLGYAKREETRRKMYVANQNKVPQNIALHRNLALIRDKLARFLGFSSHMASVTSDRMVGNPGTVAAMVEQMKPHLVEEGKKEVDGLLRLKNEDNVQATDGKEQTALYLWDSSYYERIRDECGASVSFNLVSEYFEVWGTLQRLMAIYEHIFDIKFEPITSERAQEILGEDSGYLTWHDEVKGFLLWDAKDKSFIGYIYFDLHPREGKYSHAGHFGLQPVSERRIQSHDEYIGVAGMQECRKLTISGLHAAGRLTLIPVRRNRHELSPPNSHEALAPLPGPDAQLLPRAGPRAAQPALRDPDGTIPRHRRRQGLCRGAEHHV